MLVQLEKKDILGIKDWKVGGIKIPNIIIKEMVICREVKNKNVNTFNYIHHNILQREKKEGDYMEKEGVETKKEGTETGEKEHE